MLTISAPHDKQELRQIDATKKAANQMAQKPARDIFFKRSASGALKWALCLYPTESMAQEAGKSVAEYSAFIENACMLNTSNPADSWRALGDRQARIINLLERHSHFQFKGPNIDIEFSTTGRTWVNSDGRRNMPSGEVFTSPVENSVQGRVMFSYPSRYYGGDVSGVELTVENGRVMRWDAQKGRETLDAVFSQDGARYFGEVAIGTNKFIQEFTHNTLFDEKIGGSIHMAVGASYPETGGQNVSAVHWDLVHSMVDGGEIIADGTLIYQNGKFCDETLN